ncbi:MAG: hypothetical protein DIU56_017065, partial [Pseudomonadota bacterium]
MGSVAQEQRDLVVHGPAIVLAHVVWRVPVARNALAELMLAVAKLERSADDLPALAVEPGAWMAMHLLPVPEDPLDALGALPVASGRPL